jgi:two-component system sensor histidine kinase KdpD
MRREAGPVLAPDERRLFDALADQVAVAIERITLARDVDQARILAETERLRSALLTSISHDLKTPLAAIIGAITSLRSYEQLYDANTRAEMLATAQDEAERLNRFVANLLDMTRLDSGALELKREMIDLSDLIGSALQRLKRELAGHRVSVDLAPGLPMVRLDFVLTQQVLVNLLDNAAKYAPQGTRIRIRGATEDEALLIDVLDEGPGVPPEAMTRIFDKFYRVQASDRQRAGTGLGLAIARGFVEAQGGTITVRNRKVGGAAFRIAFPLPVVAGAAIAPSDAA